MTTRDELVVALAGRYALGSRADRGRMLDEFAALTGHHRKHAMRLLRAGVSSGRSSPRPDRRMYDQATREALIVVVMVLNGGHTLRVTSSFTVHAAAARAGGARATGPRGFDVRCLSTPTIRRAERSGRLRQLPDLALRVTMEDRGQDVGDPQPGPILPYRTEPSVEDVDHVLVELLGRPFAEALDRRRREVAPRPAVLALPGDGDTTGGTRAVEAGAAEAGGRCHAGAGCGTSRLG